MLKFFVRAFAVFGLVTLLAAVGIGFAAYNAVQSMRAAPEVEMGSVLVADLRDGLGEREDRLFPGEFGTEMNVPNVVRALHRAAGDARISALIVRASGDGIGLAAAQELSTAIAALRAAGKTTIYWSDTLGDFSGGNVGMVLASAFDEIVIQRLGTVGLTGIQLSTPFVADLLQELHLEVEVTRREDYKTALDSLTGTAPRPEQVEQQQRLADALYGQILQTIADGRGLGVDAIERAVSAGPLLAGEAVTRGLIDGVGTYAEARQKMGLDSDSANEVSLKNYLRTAEAPDTPEGRVAFIHAVGQIVRGSTDGPGNDNLIAGDTFAAAIEAARKDEVDAVVLRVSSPGGSALASETIGEQVRLLKQEGIPVIVSMADLAASGGYWISMDADAILVQPATLTGSIGVIAAWPATREFWRWLGVEWSSIAAGDNAELLSSLDPMDAQANARLNAFLDNVYGEFLNGVAQGRDLDAEAVRAVAQGQVWTGVEAIDNGLVDGVGTVQTAVDLAFERAGLDADTAVLEAYPKRKDPLSVVFDQLGVHAGLLQQLLAVIRGWQAQTDGLQLLAPSWSRSAT